MDSERVERERRLRRAVLQGDERAWTTWYEESFTPLAAFVGWRCAGLRDLADETVQETWLIAVRRVQDFDPAQSSFLNWLRGIAANIVRNSLRRRQRQMQHSQSLNGAAHVAAEGDRAEQGERIALALAALPEPYERVLRAKYLEQQSVAEIAASSTDTPKAVESMLTRARQAFREVYQRLE